MPVKIIVAGKHSAENMDRFRNLPDADIVFAEDIRNITEGELKDAEMFAGPIKKEIAEKMPKLRFVQLYSAGAESYSWLPEKVMLANAYGAYGDSIAEHMITVTMMAMKRMPEYLQLQHEKDWKLLHDIVRFENSHIMSVGMGAIGTSYLKKASALGAQCWGVRRTVHDKPEFVEKLVSP